MPSSVSLPVIGTESRLSLEDAPLYACFLVSARWLIRSHEDPHPSATSIQPAFGARRADVILISPHTPSRNAFEVYFDENEPRRHTGSVVAMVTVCELPRMKGDSRAEVSRFCSRDLRGSS